MALLATCRADSVSVEATCLRPGEPVSRRAPHVVEASNKATAKIWHAERGRPVADAVCGAKQGEQLGVLSSLDVLPVAQQPACRCCGPSKRYNYPNEAILYDGRRYRRES